MCLAITCKKGTDKNSDKLFEAIRTASITNDDGMGYAYKRFSTKKVFLSKGFKDVELFIDAIKSKKLKENDELIVHLRIGNKGSVNTDMCHPFVASEEHDEIIANDVYVDKPVFIHNGTLMKYSEHNSIFSDTYFFAKKFLSKRPVQAFLKSDIDLFKEYFKDHISTSRFAIIFPGSDQEVIMLGEYTEDEGYYFSNSSYKSAAYRNVGGKTVRNNHYASWDWDGDDYNYNPHAVTDYYNRKPNDKAVTTTAPYGTPNINTKKSNSLTVYKDDYSEDDSPFVDTYEEAKNNARTLFPVKTEEMMMKFPKGYTGEVITDKYSKESYKFFMGLWFPISQMNSMISLDQCKIDINELNYNTVNMRCKDIRPSIHLSKDVYYKINNFDFNMNASKRQHSIMDIYKRNGHNITVCASEIPECFSTSPTGAHIAFYDCYFNLVKRIEVSRNKMKNLAKILKNDTTTNAFKYESDKYIPRQVLELFLFNMFKQFYGDDYLVQFSRKTI